VPAIHATANAVFFSSPLTHSSPDPAAANELVEGGAAMNRDIHPRVILLEDNKAILTLLREIFDDRGYEIYAFPNPSICPLQLIPECRCAENQTCTDLIVSDLNMPTMTGLRFIRNQRQKNCKCKYVAMISASWTEEDLETAQQLGCKTFTKPLFFDDLDAWLDGVEYGIDPKRELRNWFQERGALPQH
jgi:CheY-like chemotaxis protein